MVFYITIVWLTGWGLSLAVSWFKRDSQEELREGLGVAHTTLGRWTIAFVTLAMTAIFLLIVWPVVLADFCLGDEDP